jgi:4-hydroxy-tetrahydrodipicolinate synthase
MALSPNGVYTAIVTPFSADGSAIDWPAYERLVQSQLEGGVSGIVPCGTTGESPTLSDAEQRELIARTVRQVNGRVSVLAGTGTNSTKKTVEYSKAALEAGADGVMLMMPYYNRPSQAGLLSHISLVAKAVSCPIVLYNIPGRSAVELQLETLLEILEACPNVVGLKDATGGVLYCHELAVRAPGRLFVLCGDDPLTVPMMAVGATGVISVTSNLYPRAVSEVVADVLGGRWADAQQKNLRLFPVHRALFSEPSPQPIKAALALKGVMMPTLRPPLVEAGVACRARLSEVMRAFEAA